MCACGCFLLIGIVAALIYCFIHGLWLALGAICIFGVIVGWAGNKMRKESPAVKARAGRPQ